MKTTSRKARSPYTQLAVGYVEKNPGCCKFDLARYLTRHPQRCPSKQYYLVNTQLRLGNIVAVAGRGNSYALYTPEALHAKRAAEVGLPAETPAGIVRDARIDAGLES